jgi:hypothetical protein
MSKVETYSSESIFHELKQNKPGHTNEAMRELNCDLHRSKDFNATYQHLQQRISQYNKTHKDHLPDLKLLDDNGKEITDPSKADRKHIRGFRYGSDDSNTEYKRDTYRHQVKTDTVDGGYRVKTDSATGAKQAYDAKGQQLQTVAEKGADGKETGRYTVTDKEKQLSTTYDKDNKMVEQKALDAGKQPDSEPQKKKADEKPTEKTEPDADPNKGKPEQKTEPDADPNKGKPEQKTEPDADPNKGKPEQKTEPDADPNKGKPEQKTEPDADPNKGKSEEKPSPSPSLFSPDSTKLEVGPLNTGRFDPNSITGFDTGTKIGSADGAPQKGPFDEITLFPSPKASGLNL